MSNPELILACITDFGGRVRGKGFRARDRDTYARKGVGLAPSNLMITTFGEIVQTPWGPYGDLLMMPDPATETLVDHGDVRASERFVLCNLTELDGSPWVCCPRSWLAAGLAALEADFGLKLFSAFEHEFTYSGVAGGSEDAYGLERWREQGDFLSRLMGALEAAGVEPEMVMPEYGKGQFEVTNAPALGLGAADRAVILREVTRSVARAGGERASFAPVMGEGEVGNGVHVHFSLQDREGPCSHDPVSPHGLSAQMASFSAGVLAHMTDILALTAASAISYERLQPNRWSAAYNNFSAQDREAGLRVCPLAEGASRDGFNVEYRAADASANPYLLLGAIVWAGLDGLRRGLPAPTPTDGNPAELSVEDAKARGIERLPTTLGEALDRMERSSAIGDWMGEEFRAAYVMNKRSELSLLDGLDLKAQVARYVACF